MAYYIPMLRFKQFFREQDQPVSQNFVVVGGGASGCWSYVGMIGGGQGLNLGSGCHYSPTIIHEFMHALGVHHYQNRPDRDDQVTIFFNNIEDGKESNFHKEGTSEMHGTEYDVKSLMHYFWNAFAKDSTQPTILSKVYMLGTDFRPFSKTLHSFTYDPAQTIYDLFSARCFKI